MEVKLATKSITRLSPELVTGGKRELGYTGPVFDRGKNAVFVCTKAFVRGAAESKGRGAAAGRGGRVG